MENYRCVTSVQEIQQYVSNAAVVAFDYETAPDEPYRIEEKAALDPAKSHIVGCSFSAKEHTAVSYTHLRAYGNLCSCCS